MTALALHLPPPGLVRAEILKLRKRRGLVVRMAVTTVGAAVVTYGVLAVLHAANPARHGPAGGVTNLGHGLFLLSAFGTVAAAFVGAAVGTGDLGAGVFRELVVTGRPRRSLFAARIPGGLAFLLAFVGAGYAIAAIASVAFAGSLPAPSTSLLIESGLWLELSCAFYFALALGIASLFNSRSTTIGILLAFRLAVTPVLLSIGALGVGREVVPGAALGRIAPHALHRFTTGSDGIPMSVSASVVVLALWVAVAIALGAWRTMTRDA